MFTLIDLSHALLCNHQRRYLRIVFILLESMYDVKIKDTYYYINHEHTHTKNKLEKLDH